MKDHELRPLLPTVMLLLVTACGGGGGGGDQGNLAPPAGGATAAITSPSTNGVTDEETLTVRGTTNAGTGTVSDVKVAGMSASTTDGFATWMVEVPLGAGLNALSVDVVDGAGNTASNTDSRSVRRVDPILVEPTCVALDSVNELAFVADPARGEILAVDLSDGSRERLSGEDLGSGPLFLSAQDMVLDAANELVYLFDPALSAIFEIDLRTGDRVIVFTTTTADTPSLQGGMSLALGPDAGQLMIVSTFHGLLKLNLSTDTLSTISKDKPGLGPVISTPRGLAYDPVTRLAYITEAGSKKVLVVNVDSGERFVLSENGVTAGPNFLLPRSCDLDPSLGLIVMDGLATIYSVHLTTGERTELSGAKVGEGAPFKRVTDLVVGGGRAIVTDPDRNELIDVVLVKGDRNPVGGTSIGSGPFLEAVFDMMLAEDGSLLTPISLPGGGELSRMDPASGIRQVISGQKQGTGVFFVGIRNVDVHPILGKLLVTDLLGQVFEVDTTTGEREIIATKASAAIDQIECAIWHPTSSVKLFLLDDFNDAVVELDLLTDTPTVLAPLPATPVDFALDFPGNRLIVLTRTGVFGVDLTSGAVETISTSDNFFGSGETIFDLRRLAVDSTAQVAYVRDVVFDKLVAVDLDTGLRTLVSSRLNGSGEELSPDGGTEVSADGKTLFAFDEDSASILAVTIETGDRLFVAR